MEETEKKPVKRLTLKEAQMIRRNLKNDIDFKGIRKIYNDENFDTKKTIDRLNNPPQPPTETKPASKATHTKTEEK